MLTPEQIKHLKELQDQAYGAIAYVKYCIILAEATTLESDGMTADYIWGNCSLDELLNVLQREIPSPEM